MHKQRLTSADLTYYFVKHLPGDLQSHFQFRFIFLKHFPAFPNLISWPRGHKTIFMLNSAIFSANKYEISYFHIYQQWNFLAQLCLVRKKLQCLIFWDLLAGQISCSAEFSTKKSFITSGAEFQIIWRSEISTVLTNSVSWQRIFGSDCTNSQLIWAFLLHLNKWHDINLFYGASLRKHAYSIYWEFYHQKMKIFGWNFLIFFLFLLKNIDCGY